MTFEGRTIRKVGLRKIVEVGILLLLVAMPLSTGYLFSDFYIALFLRVFIFGIMMGVVVRQTRGLLLAVVIHAIADFWIFLLIILRMQGMF